MLYRVSNLYKAIKNGFTSWRSIGEEISQLRLLRYARNAENGIYKYNKNTFPFIVCLLIFCQTLISCSDKNKPINFADDIAPIIHKNCSKCHIDGEAGPFNLVTYQDVKSKAKLIAYITENRIMPPWPADASYTHFANEMVLTQEQIETIKKWVEQGTVAGDTSKLERPEILRKELQLGKADLILRFPEKIKVTGNNMDMFLVCKLPYEIPHDTFVRAIEYVAGNKRLVHHVNVHLIQFEDGKKRNVIEGKNWVNQDQSNSQIIHKELGILHDDGTYPAMSPSVCNYLPGSQFSFYPKEIGGYKLSKKGALYLNDMHFGPSPKDDIDSSYFKIYFSPTPPKRPVQEFQMGTLGIAPVEPKLVVQPETVKTFHIKADIPEDISVLTIVPHMHLIGKKFWAYAIKPSGDTIRLVRINNWDFRWQYFYQPKTMLHIPRGSTIYVEGLYDNTSNNPNNPFSPPQVIMERNGSMKTTDEMFQLIMTYVPYQKGDEEISLENIEP